MPETRPSKHGPAYLATKPDPIILARDFDQIPEAEEQHVSWINRGHSYDARQEQKP
jgi:hypothetical protein